RSPVVAKLELAPDTVRLAVCGAPPKVADAKLAAPPWSTVKLPRVISSELLLVQLEPVPVIATARGLLLLAVVPIWLAPAVRSVPPAPTVKLNGALKVELPRIPPDTSATELAPVMLTWVEAVVVRRSISPAVI